MKDVLAEERGHTNNGTMMTSTSARVPEKVESRCSTDDNGTEEVILITKGAECSVTAEEHNPTVLKTHGTDAVSKESTIMTTLSLLLGQHWRW